ncbi:hypothetical protein NB693_21570 [Pantoea ananatis]|nr:hypothetical protein [Pantoea ananatis]
MAARLPLTFSRIVIVVTSWVAILFVIWFIANMFDRTAGFERWLTAFNSREPLSADGGTDSAAGRPGQPDQQASRRRADAAGRPGRGQRRPAPGHGKVALRLRPAHRFRAADSYQERDYIRQQGLPWEGSAEPNRNGKIDRALFTGEPGQRPYHSHQSRIGYVPQSFGLDGFLIANNGLAANLRTLRRTATQQQFDGRTWVQDTYLQGGFATGTWQHTVTAGLDAFKTWEWNVQSTCRVGNLDVYAPRPLATAAGSAPRPQPQPQRGPAGRQRHAHRQQCHDGFGSADVRRRWRAAPVCQRRHLVLSQRRHRRAGRAVRPSAGARWNWRGSPRYDLRRRNSSTPPPTYDGWSPTTVASVSLPCSRDEGRRQQFRCGCSRD